MNIMKEVENRNEIGIEKAARNKKNRKERSNKKRIKGRGMKN